MGKFLAALAAYVQMKNAGQPNEITRFLRLGAGIVNAGKAVKEELEVATAKIETLILEDRQPTDLELAEVDASIESKLQAIAAVDLSDPPPVG